MAESEVHSHGPIQRHNQSTTSIDSGVSDGEASMHEERERKSSDVSPRKENGYQEDSVDVKEKDTEVVKELAKRVDQLQNEHSKLKREHGKMEKRLQSLETSSASSTPEMNKKENTASPTSARRASASYPLTQPQPETNRGQGTKAAIARTSSDASPQQFLIKAKSKLGLHVPKALSAGDATDAIPENDLHRVVRVLPTIIQSKESVNQDSPMLQRQRAVSSPQPPPLQPTLTTGSESRDADFTRPELLTISEHVNPDMLCHLDMALNNNSKCYDDLLHCYPTMSASEKAFKILQKWFESIAPSPENRRTLVRVFHDLKKKRLAEAITVKKYDILQ